MAHNAQNMNTGLTNIQAKEALTRFGYNELPTRASKNILKVALDVLKEPMFILLICCGLLYVIMGDYREGSILLSATLVIIFITFYQQQKTERALESLKSLSSPRALVIREGVEKRIPGRELVPGDIILLNEGDRIAADATIIQSFNLQIDESMLTGESVPVKKNIKTTLNSEEGLAFSGTLVVKGRGVAKVFATGLHTNFGKIGSSLASIKQTDTRLQLEMKLLIKKLFLVGVLISMGVMVAFYFSRGNLIHSILNGLATSMAILPEEFPVVLTVFMAIGAWRLSKKNVLTRKPSAIETLGSTTVLCVDKTGTITQNRMQVVLLYDGVTTIDKENLNQVSSQALLLSANRASHHKSIEPMEKAINDSLKQIQNEFTQDDLILVKEFPLSHELPVMTYVYERAEDDDHYFIYSKGAPELVFSLCSLSEDERQKHTLTQQSMADNAFRVLAVAQKILPKGLLPIAQDDLKLDFTGLIAFEDPIRPEVPSAIKQCITAGIKVIIITGDFSITANAIAKKIGLLSNGGVLTGEQLDAKSDFELTQIMKDISVFARVVPAQKLRIVQVLKSMNEVVAMTGDGVNDAPALKAADIGIAMGNRGTDVARESSSLVLLDDNFASIVAAIRSGRKIFDNLQKAMSYILAIHIPIIGLTLLPALFSNIPLLLLPIHIVFLELIIDPISSIAFESETEEKGIMNRKPRSTVEKFFGTSRLLSSLSKGVLMLIMIVSVYFITIQEGHTEKEMRAIVYTTLIIGNVFLILSSLSTTRSFIAILLEKNYNALFLITLAIAMLIIILNVPVVQNIFSLSNPGFIHFSLAIIAATILLFILETIKKIKF